MAIQFQLIAPGRSWLHTQPQRDRDRVARQEIRRQATRALAEIDAAVAGRARPTGSTCGKCRAPIATTATWCPTCTFDYVTCEYRTNDQLGAEVFRYAVESGVERSRQVGPILEVR